MIKSHLHKSRYCDIVPLHSTLKKFGLKDALQIRLLLSANPFQSKFSGHTIFTFHFNEEHVFLRQ